MRRVVVFVGPTLSLGDAQQALPGAEFLAPARRGDVYRACLTRPWGIAVIDGYFEHQLSIWHKEVLWALASGVRVYGAASMGALRAAELEDFGMIGVGSIFTRYRDGQLEDDDEVVVAHAPAVQGYVPVSVAMVNIRATLERAGHLEIASPQTIARLIELSKRTFYPERSLRALVQRAPRGELPVDELERLSAWLETLPRQGVDVKAADALELLRRIRNDLATPPAHAPPRFHFEHTEAWDEFLREMHEPQPQRRVMSNATGSTLDVSTRLDVAIRFDPARASEFQSRLEAYIPNMAQTFGWACLLTDIQGPKGLCYLSWGIPSPDNLLLVERFERETQPLPEWWVAMGELVVAERMELLDNGQTTVLMDTLASAALPPPAAASTSPQR